MKTVLSIAGSDCSGGAGIQADIKTITSHKLYAMSAITALTAQNTTGVYGVMESTPEFLVNQLDCIFTDIYPDAIKIGMVSNEKLIKVIVEKLKEYKAKNIVVDPVMISTSGSKLLEDGAKEILINELLPLATIITPNIPESEVLCGIEIKEHKDMERAAEIIGRNINGSILIKGGHSLYDANDLLYSNGSYTWIKGKKIDNINTHGTGCTLSSAIASNLALGYSVLESVEKSKKYISEALKANLNLGKGSGPLNHCFSIKGFE
ncbi:bifunctional hydroxymethylpyrimidine kinase/phosphomethylpyrimidine kinase [Tissierella sp. Yu-01]|uniref:bifunctional hydroxymethylpyrimidine kinase/phosphomethylpyrimidine kinase n=1 Tax=Tissierella sp. Yu-01 TaxID=3035694 RepID=UPI00240E74F5|nr:bifunctional hydroxymethylpyrimidine kinase/phosphomethylpyrimidine kinase [Tissierella sp. Yu-01]WFA08413.1 bifunctional hydroxymethylpyrimidine kinase/phosphomethylpyrimidine kinase [Tissierella sp. Yu-01]